MKKLWIFLCVAILCVALLASCGEKTPGKTPDDGTPEVTTVTDDNSTVTTSGDNNDAEPNPAFVDDRPNGNNTKPDPFN